MSRLQILTLVAILLAVFTHKVKNQKASTIVAGDGLIVQKSWFKSTAYPLTPVKDRRPADQTFLTYPEWFLVFSPAEQADYFKTHTSTSFPYTTHISQLWAGYGVVYDQIKTNFKFNTGYHVMNMVIAGSTTIEYAIKTFYETVAGRVTDTGSGEEMTAEDHFNAQYQHNYVTFIEALPWYEFNFNHQLKALWTNTPMHGPNLLRKIERRYYLTTELLIKSGYGWLIGLGTRSAYETASLQTAVVLNGMTDSTKGYKSAKDNLKLPGNKTLIYLPRYAAFATAAEALASRRVNFAEIAGNSGAIMLTILSDKDVPVSQVYNVLFKQPIATRPGQQRTAIVTTVPQLSKTLNLLLNQKVKVEHVYDY